MTFHYPTIRPDIFDTLPLEERIHIKQEKDEQPDEKPLHYEPTLADHLRQAIETINQEDQNEQT